ncbi:MAG: hypothetical protein GY854_03005 [Deltaproteobacteria bacterium]|nr:hypothetical protein [Deltaproteobacteria bacterium]
MSTTKKTVIALSLGAAATVALIATRPDPTTIRGTAKASLPTIKESPVPLQLPTYSPSAAKIAAPVTESDGGSGKDIHGPSDVVRSRDRIETQTKKRRQFAPKWDSPSELTFASLKRHYRRYQSEGDFGEDQVQALSGAAIKLRGAVMPIDPVPKSGEMKRFWLSNPVIVMAGCVFCRPPTLADIVYVTMPEGGSFRVDREKLYRGIVITEILGRLDLGPVKTDNVDYLFGLDLKKRLK